MTREGIQWQPIDTFWEVFPQPKDRVLLSGNHEDGSPWVEIGFRSKALGGWRWAHGGLWGVKYWARINLPEAPNDPPDRSS